MFASTLSAELAKRIGSQVEIALDDSLFEGILLSVSGELLTIIQSSGYGPGVNLTISIPSINFIRLPQAA
ncbi:hypothetical protein ACFX4Y_25530 [Priestia sp. YIM B13446]|jgi:hypothetical protein|uniref:hypothetical protein n=1 Tax=Priestia TaxID=2800373 RepID=UPI00138F5A62|nr:hypothetical protein [Priestia megaterium]MCF8890906.1 hypothetical protein [Priestia megaterium]NEW00394.1 hypothetical protein [Priestia megaterium]